MRRIRIKKDTLYSLLSIISLIYIYYYQTSLYYKKIMKYTIIFDKIYEYIAIPSFFFFLSAFITIILLNIFNISIKTLSKRIFAIIVAFTLIIYITLILINVFEIINLPIISFISIYSFIFSILGCVFALASHKKNKEG